MTLATKEPQEQTGLAKSIEQLEGNFAIAVKQRELLERYIHERLKPGKHFYKMSNDQKPSLTKEGAELVCLPHALKPSYEIIGGPAEPPNDDTPYQLTVRCTLMKQGMEEGQGIGSASSHITKRDGQRIPRQNDIGLRHNATLKMAQKSAYIAATLNATAASEFFTQDMEDIQGGTVTPPQSQRAAPKFVCPEHGVEWFKRGKMRNWAHPIDGSKEWCNMPEDSPESPQNPRSGAVPSDDADATPDQETGDAANVASLGAKKTHIAERFAELGILKEGVFQQKEFDQWANNRLKGMVGTEPKAWKPEQWAALYDALAADQLPLEE